MTTITTLFCLAVKTIDAKVINDAEKVAELWNAKALIANFLLLFRGWPGLSMIGYDNPLWYLCILIQCYLVFYIIRFICSCLKGNRQILELGLWFIVVILTTVLHNVIAYEQYRGIQAFGIGLLLCPTLTTIESKIQGSATGQNRLKMIRPIVVCISSGIAILTIAFTCWKQGLQREVLIIGVFIPVLLIAYVLRNRESSIARFLGRISFELFIWHAPMMAFVKLLFHLTGVESFPHSYLTMTVFTGLMILWAWFMYEQLETKIAAKVKANETKRRTSQ